MTNKLKLCFHWNAWEDYIYWRSADEQVFTRLNWLINRLQSKKITTAQKLCHALEGYFSLKIIGNHRLVYTITQGRLVIAGCRVQY